VEVIIAIFVVALGSGVATSLILSALQSNEFSRDNLTALNLAVEGIEAMREVRDANWLKFSSNKEDCWNMRPEAAVGTACVAAGKIAGGFFTPDLNLDPNHYTWSLSGNSTITTELDLASSPNNTPFAAYRLDYYDINTSSDTDNNGDAAHDHDILATQGLTFAGGGLADESPYYRMIKVEYPVTAGCDPATGDGCEEMTITSLVQWRAQGVVHQISLTSQLTDYQKIKVAT